MQPFDRSKDIVKPVAKLPVHRSGRLISTTYVYIVTRFAAAAIHSLRITITDEDVYSPQETWFTAGMTSIEKKRPPPTDALPYSQKEDLKKIALYDLDAMGLTPGQENAIVEAETDHLATIRHLLLATKD